MRMTISGRDQRTVDATTRRLIDLVEATGSTQRGPIPVLPKAGEGARRVIDVTSLHHSLVPKMSEMDVPLTVQIEIS